MPVTTTVKLHGGKVLWPQHRKEEDVLLLQETTPPSIFQTTYQGLPTDPAGTVFKREWWNGKNRYSDDDAPIGIWISLDTAISEKETAAYTAWVVGYLMKDYRLRIALVGRKHVEFPQLIEVTNKVAAQFKGDLLRGIIIEDASSGKQLIQTLRQQAEPWLSSLIIGYSPKVEKELRWSQAAVWCSLGCVLLPNPSSECPWLLDFETEIFNVPGSPRLDQADSLAQLINFLENLLSTGFKARSKKQ